MRANARHLSVVVLATLGLIVGPRDAAAITAPALPAAFLDTTLGSQPGVVRNVGTTSPGVGDRTGFINALNAAQLGDTIVLTAGAVYQGPYTLPIPKAGPGQWVFITTSDSAFLPPPGTRLVPMQAAVPPGMVANIDAAHLAKISTKLDDDGVLAVKGAHHYRFIGVEFFPAFTAPGQNYSGSVVDLGALVDAQGRGATTNADYPHDIIFDRCYFHGGPQSGTRRGLRGNANALAVIDSYFADFKQPANDTQALSIDHTNGPFKIVNNYLEGAGENIIFGGADPVAANTVPADIEIRSNFFFKPVSWRFFDPTFGAPGSALVLTPGGTLSSNGTTVTTTVPHGINGAAILGSSNGDMIRVDSGPQAGQMRRVTAVVNSTTLTIESAFSANQAGVTWSDLRAWVVKNLLELKNARRVLVEGNVFMQNWGGQGQAGSAIVITVRNQDGTAPWSTVSDVTFRKNLIQGSGQGFSIHGKDPDFVSQRSVRMAITDNVIDDINSSWMPPGGSSQDGRLLLLNRGMTDFRFEHNTAIHTGHVVATTNNQGPEPGTIGCPLLLDPSGPCNVPNSQLVFRNNLLRHNRDGFMTDFGVANQGNAFTAVYLGLDFANNLLAGPFPTTDGVSPALYGTGGACTGVCAANFFDAVPGSTASSLDLTAGAFFVNPPSDDYHLVLGSIYKIGGARAGKVLGGAADGKDLGADVDAVALATQGVVSGVPGNVSLTVGKLGSGTGTVASSPGGINCGSDCTEVYPSGATLTLTATPSAGSLFTGFAGACAGTAPCPLTMNGDKTVSATFTLGSILQLSSATYSVNENGGTATITVTRTGGTTGTVTVQFATSNGTALAGTHYQATSGTLTFTSGASQTFTIPIIDNGAVTGNKTINLTLSAPGGSGAQLGAPSTAVLTIVDNDQAGTVQFAAATASVSESAGAATLTVSRTGGSASGVTVGYAVTGGTAPNDGSRFVLASGTLTFGAGGSSQPITVTIVNNAVADGDKTVVVTLSNPQGGAALGAQASTTLTIADDDVAPPGAATLVAPTGSITTTTPTFTWNAVSGTTQYLLWVDDSSGGRLRQWYAASQTGCASGTGVCSLVSPMALNPGNGRWWIVAANGVGSGPWSAEMDFTVAGTPPPGQATPIAPSGSISTATPTFTWNAVAGATQYLLWLDDASGGRVRHWYTATETGCAGGTGTCSLAAPVTLTPGGGRWWVVTGNASGSGPWSVEMDFTVAGTPPPGKATPIAPSGSVANGTPTFTWNAVSGATQYLLWLDDSSGGRVRQWYSATQTGCAGGTGTCSLASPVTLNPGAGRWWIVTGSASGSGPWSVEMDFTVPGTPPPGQASLLAPSGSIATATPTFTWNAVSGATQYLLWLDDGSGGRVRQWYSAAQTGCAGGTGTCSLASPVTLNPGAGRWWIVTGNASGSGPWSAEMDFVVP